MRKNICCRLACRTLRVRWVLNEDTHPWTCVSVSASRLNSTEEGGKKENQLHIGFSNHHSWNRAFFLLLFFYIFREQFSSAVWGFRYLMGDSARLHNGSRSGASQLLAGDKDPLSRSRLCRLIWPAPLGRERADRVIAARLRFWTVNVKILQGAPALMEELLSGSGAVWCVKRELTLSWGWAGIDKDMKRGRRKKTC